MGNVQYEQRDDDTIIFDIGVSNSYHLENIPIEPPSVWQHRIDQQLWDELYQEVMSCEAYGMNHNLRKQHNRLVVFHFVALTKILGGMINIYSGSSHYIFSHNIYTGWALVMDIVINWFLIFVMHGSNISDTGAYDYSSHRVHITWLTGVILFIIGVIIEWYVNKKDKLIRIPWIKNVRSKLHTKLVALNAKYQDKIHFTLDAYDLRLMVEIKIAKVKYLLNAEQSEANLNQQLIVSKGDNDLGYMQMPDDRLVACRKMERDDSNYKNCKDASLKYVIDY